jgi:3-oxoacyl-[acyl-carrier protein] reductase
MISSISSYRSTGRADYVASKAAINGMVHVASREAAAFGMTVNGVAPGAIDTPLFHQVNSPERTQGVVNAVPLGRLGQPEDIAAVVAFLASEAAAYITGTIVDVDGGITTR